MPWDPLDYEVTLVQSLDELLDFREWLGQRRPYLGCDIETSGFNLGSDVIRLFQMGDLRHGWSLPWADWAGAIKELVPRLTDKLVFHNAAFDLGFLERDHVKVHQHLVHDTMVLAHLVDPRRTIALKPLAARYVNRAAMMGKNALAEAFRVGGWDYATIPVDHPAYYVYAAMDTSLTAALADVLKPLAEPYRNVYDIEMACLFVIRNARLAGLSIDVDYAVAAKARLQADIERVRTLIPFAPSKDKEASNYFQARGQERGYGLELADWWPFRTEKGAVSLDDHALKAFEPYFPEVIPQFREYRTKAKLVASYFNNMLRFHVDGVLRCNVKTLGARTARMSITEPALQQLPRGRMVRDGFIARPGHKLVLADFEQMEARMFASDAGCQAMLDAFERSEDLHAWVAAEVYYDGDKSRVLPRQRQVTKSVNYAKLYGAGPATIAMTAGVPTSEVEDFISRYNERFPEVADYTQRMLDECAVRLRRDDEPYIYTVLGRRLPVDQDRLYAAINYRAQGSGGDILKVKLIEMANAGLSSFIRLPVHDEILMEVPDEEIAHVIETTHRVMPELHLFDCPLTIETDVVTRWGEHYEEDPAFRGHWTTETGWTQPLTERAP